MAERKDYTGIARELRSALRFLENEEVLEIGKKIPGQGVYIGQYLHHSREGTGLRTLFNVFAAPEDLPGAQGQAAELTFNAAVKRMDEVKYWHGHGLRGLEDNALYGLLDAGVYKGEWVIPTYDILQTTLGDAIRGKSGSHGIGGSMGDWYMSCTEDREGSSQILAAHIFGRFKYSMGKDTRTIKCRPVRLVEVKP